MALRLLSSLLFGVTSTDVVSLVAAPIVLMAVAVISIAARSWRASRADAVVALREQ